MKATMRASNSLMRQLAATRWRWIVIGGIAIPLIAVTVWVALAFSYGGILAALAHGRPDRGQVEQFGRQGAWAVPVLVLALTAGGASWVARRAGGPILVQGAALGVAAATGGLLLWSLYHGSPSPWAWVAAILTVGAGWLGGLEAQSAAAGRESLYRASRAIAAARDPQAIVAAIGEQRIDPRVRGVALWQVTTLDAAGSPAALALLAAWVPPGGAPLRLDPRLGAEHLPLLARLRRDAPTALTLDALSTDERVAWERLGGHDTILVPLIGRDGGWLGLITIASPAARGLGGATGGYVAIGAQAAVVLENLRLVEEGRRSGALAERQRLAREIHDVVKQQVFATGMQIGAALALIERDPAAAKERLVEADALVRQAQDDLAAVIRELRPATLGDRGLAATLFDYAARWSRQADIPAEVRVNETCDLPLEMEQALFRVAQEALANVARHSRATAATVTLACADGAATLEIADDGRGFAPDALDRRGYGLLSMGERVAVFGGRVTVESAPGRGTQVRCVCPIAHHREAETGETWANR